MQVVAIVQARMGSTRFPGKVLKPLAGKPILWHVVHRLNKSDKIDLVIVATSNAHEDNAILDFCREHGIRVFRGPEQNVLARYSLVIQELHPEIIVRVTGDAPLIDPGSIDQMIARMIRSRADVCTFEPTVPSIHEGFSVVTKDAFDLLEATASDDPIAQEHVTGYFKNNSELVSATSVPVPEEEQFEARISVDTPEDLDFLERVYQELAVPPGDADIPEVVDVLKRDPELRKINQEVARKGLRTDSPTILIYCEGGAKFGCGHLSRTRSVGEVLRSSHGADVRFALLGDQSARNALTEREFRVKQYPGDVSEDKWLDEFVIELEPDALILDVRQSDLSTDSLREWRRRDILVAGIDDITERRLATDLMFYPPVPQVDDLDWSEYDGTVCADWKWSVVDEEFDNLAGPEESDVPTVLVTMGGSDPENMTCTTLRGIHDVDAKFETILVLGDGFQHHAELDAVLADSSLDPEIHHPATDMPGLMARADLAITSFGVTAYELGAMGVPAIHLCLTPDHEKSSHHFEDEGMAVCLGVHDEVQPGDVASALQELLERPQNRAEMRTICRRNLDNRGGRRIADRVMAELEGDV